MTHTVFLTARDLRRARLSSFLFRRQVERGERSGVFKFIYHWREPKNIFQRIWWMLTEHWEADIEWIEEPIKGASPDGGK